MIDRSSVMFVSLAETTKIRKHSNLERFMVGDAICMETRSIYIHFARVNGLIFNSVVFNHGYSITATSAIYLWSILALANMSKHKYAWY